MTAGHNIIRKGSQNIIREVKISKDLSPDFVVKAFNYIPNISKCDYFVV